MVLLYEGFLLVLGLWVFSSINEGLAVLCVCGLWVFGLCVEFWVMMLVEGGGEVKGAADGG